MQHPITIRERGLNINHPKERVGDKIRAQQVPTNGSTLRLYGAKSTKNMVIRPTGVSTTPTALANRLPIPMDRGVTPAIALVIPPHHALPPPFASLPKGKANGRKVVKVIMVNATGKARISLLIIIRTRLLRHCMMKLLRLQLKAGGKIMN